VDQDLVDPLRVDEEKGLFKTLRSDSDQVTDWLDLLELDATVFEEIHTIRGNNHFTHYCYTERILASKKTRRMIEGIVIKLFSETNFKINCLIHPANLGATLLAQIIATRLPYPTRVVSLPSEGLRMAGDAFVRREAVPSGGNVLLVDDSANSGSTLLKMRGLLNKLPLNLLGAFVLIDRLTNPMKNQFLENQFEIFSVLRVNVPVYTRDNCPLCDERKNRDNELKNCFDADYRNFLLDRIRKLKPQIFSIYGDRIIARGDTN